MNYTQAATAPNPFKYFIFSDESGSWHDKNNGLYVRSWVRITPEQYRLLQKEVLFLKHQAGITELKWENLKKNPHIFNDIFSRVDFSVFITVSNPQHFFNSGYSIINDIKNIPTSTGGYALTATIKKKVVKSTYNQLFLTYYERQHIENSVGALLTQNDLPYCKYVIDIPQFPPDDWTDRAEACGIPKGNVKIIKNSSNEPGIELADLIAGCASDVLVNSPEALGIYQTYIQQRMVNMSSHVYPNPNLIFHSHFTREVKDNLLRGFRP